MDLFVDDLAVAALEQHAASADAADRASALTALAWALRQRDTARAVKLAAQARSWATPSLPVLLAARLLLIDAEARWLQGSPEEALPLAQSAQIHFEAMADPLGEGDALWLMSQLSRERADRAAHQAQLGAMVRAWGATSDPVRQRIAQWRLHFDAGFTEPDLALARWQAEAPQPGLDNLPAVAAWREAGHAVCLMNLMRGDECVAPWVVAHGAALRTGQWRMAMLCANNLNSTCNNLNAHELGLEWGEVALAIARQAQWPRAEGACLTVCARTMTELGRHTAAASLLQDALTKVAPGTHNHGLLMVTLGNLAAELEAPAEAISWYDRALLQFRHHPRYALGVQRDKVAALIDLHRWSEALTLCEATLATAIELNQPYDQAQMLRALARIRGAHSEDPAHPSTETLDLLRQALDRLQTIPGFTIPFELYDELAEAATREGDQALALDCTRLSRQARDHAQLNRARDRARALQLRHEVETLRAAAPAPTSATP